MSSKSPVLGSLAIQAPSLDPQVVHITPSTCQNLSLFKDLLREYRRLDDTINMRLNRTDAQFRDRDRRGASGKGNFHDQACAHMWVELMDNWQRRMEIIEYCVGVVDQSSNQQLTALDGPMDDPTARRKVQSLLYSNDVKASSIVELLYCEKAHLSQRNQMHNELAVEKILRQRSLDAFKSRCKYFTPPLSDTKGRKWWDVAQAGQ